jgi:hypothetical protein
MRAVAAAAAAAAAVGRQFMSIVEALNYLRDKSLKDSRDAEFVPGRMLVSVCRHTVKSKGSTGSVVHQHVS